MPSHQLQVISLALRLWELQLTETLLKETWQEKCDTCWISRLASILFTQHICLKLLSFVKFCMFV